MAILGPIMTQMTGMMNQFAQSQMQMFQALQLPAAPDPNAFLPGAFDLEAERAEIADRLKNNPADAELRRRGRASTRVVSPLEEEEDDLDILRIGAGGGPL
jgi:hypothetical protein